jgi:hypothetical protein
MVKFFVVKSIHLSSNFRFDVGVVYLRLIIFLVVGDVTIDSDDVLFNQLCESQNKVGPIFQSCS